MLKLFIGTGLMSFFFIFPAVSQSHNPRLLEEYSDEISRSLLQGVVSKEKIPEKLEFVYDERLLETQLNLFPFLYNAKIEEIKNATFLEFASYCKSIYETEITNKEKIALTMLFETVSQRFEEYLKKIEKLKKIKDEEQRQREDALQSYLKRYPPNNQNIS